MGTPNSLYQLVSALFPPDADAVYLSPAPLYHAAPMRYCLTMHRFGATVVVMEKFDPEHALAAIETYRVTHSQWVPTMGDVGYVDEDGFLYLTDRLSYMIISGGVNVYPQEAENVLAVHPEVADVAVFGIPDPDMGEQVKAVVQPVSMLDAGPELAAELIAYCRSRLTHHKCPRTIDFRADLPRHPTGKLLKRVIRDEYLRETFS
jgi:acyl-CoA synthetase (AMP-forming)/AMP-acid ligase II